MQIRILLRRRNQGTPVTVVSRMVQPGLEQGIALPGQPIEIRESRALLVPHLIQIVGRLRVPQDGVRPADGERHVHIVLHGEVETRHHRHLGHDGFEGRRRMPDRRPLHESRIAAAEHAHLAVTPGLLADPVDDVVCILAVVQVRRVLLDIGPDPAAVSDDADIAVIGCLFGEVCVAGALRIGGEEQHHRQRLRDAILPDDDRGDPGAIPGLDQDRILDEISSIRRGRGWTGCKRWQAQEQ